MATQTAEYYDSLDSATPYFSKPVGSSVQPPSPTAPEGMQFVKFVPNEGGLVNGIDDVTVVIDGSSIPLALISRVCTEEAGFSLQEMWTNSAESEESSEDSGESSEEPVPSVDVVFFDYMMFEVTVVDGGKEYKGMGTVENGDVPVSVESGDGETKQITVRLSTVETATAPTLKYYAVYKADPASYCTITFKWYDKNAALKIESAEVVKDGDVEFPTVTDGPDNWIGTWYDGDAPVVFPVTAEDDATYEFVFAPSTSDSLKIDWGLGGDEGEVSGFKWGHPYPALSQDAPEKPGYLLQGLYLVGEDTKSLRCYNTQGDPCARVTVNFAAEGAEYSLKAKWIPASALVSDLASLRSAVGIVPEPFASVPSAKCAFDMEASDTSVNFRTGFPAVFAKPLPNGKVITRQMVNAIGNLGSQEQFLAQCGGYHTFDPAFAAACEGYPKNAILHFVDATGAFRTVRSLKDANLDNFVEDPGFIGSGVYSWAEGQKISWVYADDNPTVSIDVDYSDYEDISERIFTETGVPDLYEVPFDSYLQAFAVGSLDCESLRRAPSEDVKSVAWENGDPTQEYTLEVNGMYYSYGTGTSYLDIYHRDSQSFGSVVIGGFFPLEVLYLNPMLDFYHASKICPLSPFSCGVFLSKGDKIRVRNTVAEKDSAKEVVTGNANFTQPMVHTDETLRRKYNYRFAALYRRGAVL